MLPTITIIGNISKLENKTTGSGKKFTILKISCSEKNAKGEYDNLYIDTDIWDKTSDFLNNYFKVGSPIAMTGKLYTNIYENKDGKKTYQIKLKYPSIGFVPKQKESKNADQSVNKFNDNFDDDIPF